MPPPTALPSWHIPNFVLRIENLDHQGATIFLDNFHRDVLRSAVEASYTWLYTPLTAPTQ